MGQEFLLEQFLRYLVAMEVLSEGQLPHYLGLKQVLVDQLVADGFVSYEDYARYLSEFLGYPLAQLETFSHENLVQNLSLNFPNAIRVFQKDSFYQIIISDINHIEKIELLKFQTGCDCEIYIGLQTPAENSIAISENSDDVIQLVDQLLSYAVKNQLSDLHFEPFASQLRVRIRVDGLLHVHKEIKAELIPRVISRIKVMANLNIAVSNKPQDGRLSIESKYGNKEARVNICPTLWGEKIVIRLLQDESKLFNLNELGFSETQYQWIKSALTKPQGMILVTGPTGSGKSATLYAALNQLNSTERNIVTIEDPIEIKIFGINQTAINRAVEFGFAEALRAFLRQDPDVMMVGEMRDFETADLAMKAAQTGHLMLSTLHTNNAVETLNRLLHMGIAPIHLASSIHLIIAQRLVRKLCHQCKQEIYLDNQKIYQALGCYHCYQGYKGRLAIFEFLPLAELIAETSEIIRDHQQLIALARNATRETLKDSALNLIQAGLTTSDEMLRVI